jgi:hypothetical protein
MSREVTREPEVKLPSLPAKRSYLKPERILLAAHPDLNEKWVQQLIIEDPSILGLGDLVVRDRERVQPRAGRLDLLLQDEDTKRRYEVEVQLGATDESHIVRTIEYWDLERKRYPQYDHCAVLVAENVTSRFLNVISLFNGSIPLIAIQMQALRVGEHITLTFTTVLDELSRGFVDEDEDAEAVPTDRTYWENKASKGTVALADELLEIIRRIDQTLTLKYNKFYIGLAKDGAAFNFVSFQPKKNHINWNIRLDRSDDVDGMIDSAGLDKLEYNKRYNQYKIRLTHDDIATKQHVIEELMKLAHMAR